MTLRKNNAFEQNYKFLKDDEFKNCSKDIAWSNILSLDDISISLAFELFFGLSKYTFR